VAFVRALVIAPLGIGVTWWCLRAARRCAVRDRLPSTRARRVRGLPPALHNRIASALDAAVIDVTVAHAVQIWAAAIGGATIVGLALGGPAGALGFAAVVAVALPAIVVGLKGRRARMIAEAVAPAIDTIASELRAGGTIATAVAHAARGDGPLARDFARVDTRVRLGAPLSDALAAWTSERDAPGVDVAAGALAMCTSVGGRAADALEGLATSLRDRRAVVAEARALSAQARMSALVVGGMPLLYLAWSGVADRGAFDALTGSPVGRACVAVGVGLEVVGIWWMRRILRSGSFL
jgi:tight adherence protein B